MSAAAAGAATTVAQLGFRLPCSEFGEWVDGGEDAFLALPSEPLMTVVEGVAVP